MNSLTYLLTLSIVAIIAAISFFIIGKKDKVLSNKSAILTLIIFGLLISLFGLFSYFPSITNSFSWFIIFQIIFLLLGILVAYFWQKKEKKAQVVLSTKLGGVFYVLLNLIIGMVGFTLIFNHFNDTGLAPYYSLSTLTFVLPQFLFTTFAYYSDIPNDIYKIWYYPLYSEDVNTDTINLDNAYMLEFEYTTTQSSEYINSKMKAPIEMKFGDWFLAYIDYHNNKHESNPIEYKNEDGSPQGWMFFEKGSVLTGNRYIDPEKTIQENKLSEKKIIIAKRVNQTEF